jgi:hypothetical protein
MTEATDMQKPDSEAVAPASDGSPLPCPHCGAPAELRRYTYDPDRVYYACSVPRCHYTYTDAADAVKAWNRRAKAADQVARVQALYDCMDPKGFFARKIKAILEENALVMPTASDGRPLT